MEKSTYPEFAAAQPYFDLVRESLGNRVEGEHFFDVVTDETVYEVLYNLGWPRIIKGRTDLMEAFRRYCEEVELQAADNLVVHAADNARIFIIEYEVHGTILSTGAKYDNRFCSIIAIENKKIAHWRDYMDSHSAWMALAQPEQDGRHK